MTMKISDSVSKMQLQKAILILRRELADGCKSAPAIADAMKAAHVSSEVSAVARDLLSVRDVTGGLVNGNDLYFRLPDPNEVMQ